MTLDPRLRSPKERPLFILGVVLSSIAWLAIAVTIVGLLYAALALAFVLMAHAIFLARIRGNGILVSEQQLPELHARVKAAAKLGLEQTPEVYLMQAGGVLNAFASKLMSRRFVVIYSNLADACEDPRQLDFVIGHELAHLAAGHLRWMGFLLPYRILPWVGPAYSRACEYTCDRAGLAVCGDVEQAMRGLAVLAAGGRFAQRVDLGAFIEQRAAAGGFWMSIVELNSSHPFLCKRAGELQEVVRPGSLQPVPRSVAAYPLAPVFGILTGGPAAVVPVLVFYAAIMAAIAVPNFIKFQQRVAAQQARQQQLQQQVPETPAESGLAPTGR